MASEVECGVFWTWRGFSLVFAWCAMMKCKVICGWHVENAITNGQKFLSLSLSRNVKTLLWLFRDDKFSDC